MKKNSSKMAYFIELDWSRDYYVSACLKKRILYLEHMVRNAKKEGFNDEIFLKEIEYLRSVLRQISLHNNL